MKKVGLDHLNDPKVSIEYSNDMQNVYKNIEEYNLDKENKVLAVFDDVIADIISDKKLNPIVTDTSYVSITQSYFKLPKEVKIDTTHSFIMKIPNKRGLQQISLNHSSDMTLKI